MRNKRVFVSGGAGVIGEALVNLLLEAGADIFVGDLKPCPRGWLGKLRYWQGDLNAITPQELLSFNPEVFFHLAATFERSEETFPFFDENFHHNVQLSHHLMTILKQSSSLRKVVFASSYLIYDPHLYQFKTEQKEPFPLQEEAPLYPRNTCGGAKLFHELELRFLNHFMGKQASFISARIFRVYGRRSRDVISRWVRAALRGEPLVVYRPEGQFDYIFADDVAEGLVRLAQTSYGGIVNLGSGQACSIQTILDLLKQFFPSLEMKMESSSISFEHSQADITRLKELTGWRPASTLETALPLLIAFEKDQLQAPFPPHHPAVLITSISKKMPLIEAVRSAANKLSQFQEIHGCDSQETCMGQYGVDVFWHCPLLSQLSIEDVIVYCHQHQVTALIPTRDADLIFYATHASVLKKAGIHVLISKLETILTCLDKKQFADFLAKQRFPVIPTALSISQIEAPLFVVKERQGAGSHKLGLKLTKEEAEKHSQKLEEPLFQPYIEGQEWSVDLYRSQEGYVKGCVARQRNLVVGGESQVTTTVSYPSLESLCQEMAHALDLYGHAVFQVIEDEKGEFHVIECNPRFGGASTASLAVGLESFFWFFVESLGGNLQDYAFRRSKEEVRQIRYATDRILPWSSYLT